MDRCVAWVYDKALAIRIVDLLNGTTHNDNDNQRRTGMKKIINGKKYNTDTAQLMGEAGEGYASDFYRWHEDLYRKSTGEFFLHGRGGPGSGYSRRLDDNTRIGGEELVPLTLEQAKAWVERHLEAADYEGIFGEVEE